MSKTFAVLASFLILLASFSVQAMDIDKYTSGSWINPAQDGHGFSIEVLPNGQTLIFWFVYHPDGTPTFLVAVGDNVGSTVVADAYYTTGMKFGDFDAADLTRTFWGTITLTLHSCNSATLQYASNLAYKGTLYGSGSFPLKKFTSIDGMQCAPNRNAGLFQGNFYSEKYGRVIPGFAAFAPNGEFVAVSFDAMAGVGTWSVSGKTISGAGTAVSADPNFTFSSQLTLSGQISPEYRAVGNYSISGGDYGTFDLYSISDLYRRGVSLDEIAGTYQAKNLVSGGTGTATITQSGSISGSDAFGCKYGGQITIPDPAFNLIKVTVTVSSCGVSDGTYKGYGAQIDYYNLDDGRSIRLFGTNGKYAGLFDLFR